MLRAVEAVGWLSGPIYKAIGSLGVALDGAGRWTPEQQALEREQEARRLADDVPF